MSGYYLLVPVAVAGYLLVLLAVWALLYADATR